MRPARAVAPTAKSVRLIHLSLLAGVLLFAGVAQFVLRPASGNGVAFTPGVVSALLGAALLSCGLSLLLLRVMPRRSADESADLFWTRASTPAITAWAPAEGGILLAVIVYWQSGSSAAIVVGVIGLLIFIWLRPGRLERRI